MGIRALFLILFTAAASYADTGFRDMIHVTETDGSPKCMAGQMKFGAGQLTCAGNVATVTITGGGVSGSTFTIGVSYDGGGSALTAGGTTFISIPIGGTIRDWTLVATSTGSMVVDVKKCAGFNCNPSSSIAGTEKPTLSSAWANQDASLSTWTTTVTAGDKFSFVLNSAATVTSATLSIRITQ